MWGIKILTLVRDGNKSNTEPSSLSHVKAANVIIQPNNDGLDLRRIC